MKNKSGSVLLFATFLLSVFLHVYYDESIYAVINIFGRINFNADRNLLWNVALWMVPQLWILSECAGFLENNVLSNASLLFTRGCRKKILAKYLIVLMGKAVILLLIEIMVSAFIGILCGIFPDISLKMFIEWLNIAGGMVEVMLLANIITLFADVLYAVLGVLLIEWVEIFLVNVNVKLGGYLPIGALIPEIRTAKPAGAGIWMFVYTLGCIMFLYIMGVLLVHKKQDYF